MLAEAKTMRNMATLTLPILLASVALFAACSYDEDGMPVETLTVSGTVVDFESNETITSGATVSTNGITPSPLVSIDGANFSLTEVPPHSLFQLLTGSPPDYRSTYNMATEVTVHDLDGVIAYTLGEDYLGRLSTAFGVGSTQGALIARATDADGDGLAGVPADAFELDNAAATSGPFFLDAERQPAPGLTETSESGYVVFFDVAPGLVAVTAATDSGYTMTMTSSPVSVSTATLAEITVLVGDTIEEPQNVSFSDDIVPIFAMRGCELCHSGNGIGRDLGGLTLDASLNLIHREITEEMSPNHLELRVNIEAPEASLLLTLPSAEDPPDAHPNITFSGPADPDYLKIISWIRAGAPKN